MGVFPCAQRLSCREGRTLGNLILMMLICVAVFIAVMAIRPAPAQTQSPQTGACAIPVAWLALREKRIGDRLLSGTGRSRPRWPAPLVEPGAVFAHLLALRRRRVALAG